MHGPIQNHIKVSDGYERVFIPDVDHHKKRLSDEARVLINQVMGTPVPTYESVNGKTNMSYVSQQRGFGVWNTDAQLAYLHRMVEEGELAPHESLAVQDAIYDRSQPDTVPMVLSEVRPGAAEKAQDDRDAA